MIWKWIRTFEECSFCSFNPCFNGRWSERWITFSPPSYLFVSILVLMEDDLKGKSTAGVRAVWAGFNPCFNGRWSESTGLPFLIPSLSGVSILVLMEDDLKDWRCICHSALPLVSILVLMEDDLKEYLNIIFYDFSVVSILVLMEDDLKDKSKG